jgi:hypothetical protein
MHGFLFVFRPSHRSSRRATEIVADALAGDAAPSWLLAASTLTSYAEAA